MYMERPNYIDYAKAFCIFLVVLGHYTYYLEIDFKPSPVWYLMHTITLFHIPCFFIISGLLHKQQCFKDTIAKVWVQLIRPYFLMSAICLLIMGSLGWISGDISVKDVVVNVIGIASAGDFLGFQSEYSSPLWFLWALALIKICASTSKYSKVGGLIFTLLGIIVLYRGNFLPFRIDSASVGFLFFMLGYKLKSMIKYLFNNNYVAIVTMMISLLLLVLSASVNLDYTQRQCLSINACYFGGYPVLFLLSGISGTLLVLAISKLIEFIKLKLILLISNGTIIILGFQKIIYLSLFKGWMHSATIEAALLVALCNLFLCCMIIVIASKKAPILLGNRKIIKNV